MQERQPEQIPIQKKIHKGGLMTVRKKQKPPRTINLWRLIRRARKVIELYQIVVELIDYVDRTRKDAKLNMIVDRITALINEITG